MNNREEIIKNLNKSTLFRLSLGSKELFHSNFLAWVAENSLAFNQAIFEFLDLRECCIKSTTINREKEHIDLWLEYKIEAKTINVIIENKVKSLPYRSQLDSYAEKQESKKEKDVENYYILLSLYRPSFIDHNDTYESQLGNGKSVTWHYLSYATLEQLLMENVVEYFIIGTYEAFILKDYIEFIHELNHMGDYIRDSVENKQFFLSHPNQDWDDFNSVRMGDFYEKFRYAILAEHLYNRLKKDNKIVIMGVNPGTCKEDELSNSQDAIYIDTGMSHSNGLIDIKMVLNQEQTPKSRKVIGIQIQDGQLRRLIETNTKGKAIDIVKDKTKIKDWFDGKDECFDAGTKVQKQIDNEDIRYHSFSESFVYRRRELGKTCSLNELMDIIIKEIKNINEYVLS